MEKDARSGDDVHAVISVAREYFAATNAGDVERCIATMAADVVIIPPGQPPIFGREQLRLLADKYHASYELTYDLACDEVELAGDLAFVRATVTGTRRSRSDGSVEERVGRNFWILRRQPDGRWRFWRIMFNHPHS